MAIVDLRPATNDFVPKEDVIKRLEDGRDIVIARADTPMPMELAIEHGLVKGHEAKKAPAPSENKSQQPADETKSDAGDVETPKGGKKK